VLDYEIRLSCSGAVEEIQIGAVRRDGTPREPQPIWIVRAAGHIYVCGADGHRSSLHRNSPCLSAADTPASASVPELLDAIYREKYDSHYARTLIRR
jgi:Uncharacterized protein conserved in bacteria (DUF2255)